MWVDNLVVSGFIAADEGSAQVEFVPAYAILREDQYLANLSLVMEHSVQTEAELQVGIVQWLLESQPGGFLDLL